ncbi:hypothetical protein ElyMa_002657400 [Elysia marginata]|uniref:Uncharacterized protein n=1 Tax=Elysia marginata TaxID=1093978 RepID=A0AAV4H8A3_9GAST|nr:hypothetical protein ElyMa_002657400 [Elysia marginata]
MIDEVTERVMEEPGEDLIELKDSARSDQDSEDQDFGQYGGFDRDQETGDDIAFETGEELPYDLREALEHFESIMNVESQTKPKIVFNRVKQQLCKTETRMADRRTAKIWLQCLKMLGILRKFLRAERTGN